MGGGLRLGRAFGSEIRVHASWLLLLGFLIVGLGAVGLPDRYPSWPAGLTWVVAAASGAGLFFGVVLHEIAHLAVSRRAGVAPAPAVTLLMFGAPATLDGGAPTPGREAAIALAGPLASLLICGLAAGAAYVIAGPVTGSLAGSAATLATAAAETLLSISVLNGLVGLFNLLPVFPLDGARILRALAWRVGGDPARGSRAAASAGQFVGLGIMAAGFILVVGAGSLDGVVLLFLGWFVRGASSALGRRELLETAVTGLRVDDAMDRDLPSVPPQVTLDTFADVLVGPGDITVLPVVGPDGLVGLIGHTAVRRAGRAAWTKLRVSEVMARSDRLPVVAPEDSLRPALHLLQLAGTDGIPVLRDGQLVGVLSRHAAARTLNLHALGRKLPGSATSHAVPSAVAPAAEASGEPATVQAAGDRTAEAAGDRTAEASADRTAEAPGEPVSAEQAAEASREPAAIERDRRATTGSGAPDGTPTGES